MENLLNREEVHMQEAQDIVLQRYLSDNERYADLINGILFEGEQKVRASDLNEIDSQSFAHS